jgi:hypothetical protein
MRDMLHDRGKKRKVETVPVGKSSVKMEGDMLQRNKVSFDVTRIAKETSGCLLLTTHCLLQLLS